MRYVALLTIALSLSSLAKAASVSFRADFAQASGAFCGEKDQSLTKSRIYDAQIEFAVVKDVQDSKAFAASFAEENGHRGYSFGQCQDRRQWIASTPAPAAAMRIEGQVLKIDTRGMQGICDTYDVDAISIQRDQPVSLAEAKKGDGSTQIIALKAATYSVLSLTCHPHDRANKGPELWSLITRPELQSAAPQINSETELLEWIQTSRARNRFSRLTPASAASPLKVLVEEAAKQRDLHHPRALLLEEKTKLKNQNIQLLGENRASAPSFSALAQLLWNSPQHRRLLLNPKANLIAIHISPRENEKLLVMVLAKQ